MASGSGSQTAIAVNTGSGRKLLQDTGHSTILNSIMHKSSRLIALRLPAAICKTLALSEAGAAMEQQLYLLHVRGMLALLVMLSNASNADFSDLYSLLGSSGSSVSSASVSSTPGTFSAQTGPGSIACTQVNGVVSHLTSCPLSILQAGQLSSMTLQCSFGIAKEDCKLQVHSQGIGVITYCKLGKPCRAIVRLHKLRRQHQEAQV